jgi:hypothetical protein
MTTPKSEVAKRFCPSKQPLVLVEQLKRQKKSFYVRQTRNVTQVVCEGVETSFVVRDKIEKPLFPLNQLFIFQLVNKDALRWAKMNPDFVGNTKFPTNVYNFNYDLDHGIITGTDITSAYWYIAHKVGLISNRTFIRLLHSRYKTTKLASLAVLGREMVFDEYVDGVKAPQKAVLKPKNQALIDIYRHIRYECYRHMIQMSLLLARDFFCYKTDCIYYRDTPQNRKIVYDYLESEGLEFNQVIYDDDTPKQETGVDILKNNH